MDGYLEFLAAKAKLDPPTGLMEIPPLPDSLFPFQRDIVQWALRRGRAAIFAGTGLGKSFMELAWSRAIHEATDGNILLLTPLAVAAQMVREAKKFGIEAKHVSSQAECIHGVNVTNYQKLAHFDLSQFVGVVLDEASILKSTDGKYRTMLIKECKQIPYRLVATATPSPNDYMELGSYSEFLSVIEVWQRYASPVWSDINQTRTLQYRGGRDEKDEVHISPLQLDVIERCIDLWSNPGDTVLTPFLGIGSEVYAAVEMGRRGVGFELKPSYYAQAVRNIAEIQKKRDSELGGLFGRAA